MTEPARPDPAALAHAITAALREGRAPPLDGHNLSQFASALDRLFTAGYLDAAESGFRYIHTAYPTFEMAKNVCAFFDRMPPADGSQLPFSDDTGRDVQVVRCENSDTVILLFCGFSHRLGVPLAAMHRWFGRLPASLIYLRDFHQLFYLKGVASLGPTREATLAALRDTVAALGARRILCYGTSAGVFPALHYGLDLAAERVLGLAGPVNLTAEFNARLPAGPRLQRMHDELPHTAASWDLRTLYAAAARPPQALIVYGAQNWDDRLHAESMRGLPSVTLKSVDTSARHNVIMDLISRGHFDALLAWLLARETAP